MPAPVSMLSPGASALGASGGVGASAPAALGALDGPRVADGLGASAPERKPQGEEPEPEALFAQVSLSLSLCLSLLSLFLLSLYLSHTNTHTHSLFLRRRVLEARFDALWSMQLTRVSMQLWRRSSGAWRLEG